jgi:hypothetical protein
MARNNESIASWFLMNLRNDIEFRQLWPDPILFRIFGSQKVIKLFPFAFHGYTAESFIDKFFDGIFHGSYVFEQFLVHNNSIVTLITE